MTETPKIVPLGKPDEFKAALENLKRQMPMLIEHAQLVAKIRRASYQALIEAGFTEAQALDLCWR